MNKKIISLSLVVFLISPSAFAYLGPGMGGGIIAAVVGVIVSIFLGIFGVLYYPIKRAIKSRRNKPEEK